MNKLSSLSSLASLVAALAALGSIAACATGTITDAVTGDVSFTEGDAASDTGGHPLPPRIDSGAVGDPDGSTAADAASAPDGALDGASNAPDAADAAVAPDSATTAGACGSGFVQLGEYATWYGKVNVHRGSGGAWTVDSDCSSGADVNTVAYCQKFWPTTTKQIQLTAVTSDAKPFTSGGGVSPACGGVALSVGQAQFACCAP